MTGRDLPALLEWTSEVCRLWASSPWDSREERRLRGMRDRLVAELTQRLAGFHSRCETVVEQMRTTPVRRKVA